MKVTNYLSGQPIEISVDAVLEMHNRGPYREIKIGVDGCETKYMVMESIPEIMNKIRREKTC